MSTFIHRYNVLVLRRQGNEIRADFIPEASPLIYSNGKTLPDSNNLLCKQHFKEHFTLGRDSFYALLRANGLMLRKRCHRPRTTNSNHRFQRYEGLLNTEPQLVPKRVGELVVADITYISCQEGFACLSLITDAYSRCIVGYCLHNTLEVDVPLSALNQAFEFYKKQEAQHRYSVNDSS